MKTAFLFFLSSCLSFPVFAHSLDYQVANQQAVVVSLSYEHGEPMREQAYQLFAPGDSEPYSIGRTDAWGRVLFLPEQAGEWRIKVADAEGHGIDAKIEIGAEQVVTRYEKPLFERYAKLIAGLGLLMGLFGSWALFVQRKPDAHS